jgi:hypothetical protein
VLFEDAVIDAGLFLKGAHAETAAAAAAFTEGVKGSIMRGGERGWVIER